MWMQQQCYKFGSTRAWKSWSVPIRNVAWTAEPVGTLGFRPGSLLQQFSSAKLYVVSNNLRLPITSPDVWEWYGWSWDDVLVVSMKELLMHDEGAAVAIQ